MAQEASELMIVDDLMRDLMEALAYGHATLVEKSESPLGRLAVKSADMTLDFDLSAEAKKVGDTFRLQVKPTPFFGFSTSTSTTKSTSQVQVRNHAQLVLHIVNVPPAPEPADVPVDGDEKDNGRSDREPDDKRIENVITAIHQIQEFINSSSDVRAILGRQLPRINQDFKVAQDELASDGSEMRAKQKVEPYYAKVRTVIMAQDNIRPVKTSIETLDDWLEWQPEPEGVTGVTDWQGRLQAPLANLRQLVGGLPVPPPIKAQFTRRTKQVLASSNEKEAASRLIAAVADLKKRTQNLSLPEDVRRTLDGIELG